MMRMRNKRGQSTFELALMIVVVAAAVIAMSIFLKRSVMGKLRESGDQVGGQFTPLSTKNNYTRTFAGKRQEVLDFKGHTAANITQSEVQDRSGSEDVEAQLDQENLF